jgi:hypothetical protein
MSMPTIDQVWSRIRSLEGQEFQTKTGKPFTYSVSGDSLTPSRTDYNIGKTEFAKALSKLPLHGPGAINSVVRGPAYVWAILHDPRVRQADW